MATVTERSILGPLDHGRSMTLGEFIDAEWSSGWLYELARGVVDVTEVPGIHHGRTVFRFVKLFVNYSDDHPGVINYQAGGGECRLRLPGMVSDRHPDQAVYLMPDPQGPGLWAQWVPQIVVEILSKGGEERDYVEKREEYLRVGVLEYWIVNPFTRKLHVLKRFGDVWDESVLGESETLRTNLLPGLEAIVGELLGPANIDDIHEG